MSSRKLGRMVMEGDNVYEKEKDILKEISYESINKLLIEEESEDRDLVLSKVPPAFYDMVHEHMTELLDMRGKATDKNEAFHIDRMMADDRLILGSIIDKRLYKVVYHAVFASEGAQLDTSIYAADEKQLFDTLVPIFREYYASVKAKCLL